MSLDEKDRAHNPQYIVLNTLKVMMVNLQTSVKNLAQNQEQIKKIIESRSKKMTAYTVENEQHLKDIRESINEMDNRIKTVEQKLSEIDDFLTITKTNLKVWKKCLLFMKDFPGQIIVFFASLGTIAFFIAKYFGM